MQFNIFNLKNPKTHGSSNNIYWAIGLPRNPFAENVETDSGPRPFYTDHIANELNTIERWLNDVHAGTSRNPLSIVGNIGAGKTRIIHEITSHLKDAPSAEKMLTISVFSSDTGYAYVSLGGLLVRAINNTNLPWCTSDSPDIMPLVKAITEGERVTNPQTTIEKVIHNSQSGDETKKIEIQRLLSRWLRRDHLTQAQMNKLGLSKKIDWEGELIRIISEVIRIAKAANAVNTVFIFVDQLEEIFREAFSDLRRARFLTDLRTLIDEIIEFKTPIGLLLAWSPQFQQSRGDHYFATQSFETKLGYEYGALATRLQQHKVTIPMLSEADVSPFATTFINRLANEQGWDKKLQPDINELARSVWESLKEKKKLFATKVTPRDLIGELYTCIDRVASQNASTTRHTP